MLLFLVFTIIVAAFMVETNSDASEDEQKWKDFKTTFHKSYKTPEEEERRHKIFVETLHENEHYNLNKFRNVQSYVKGVNQFSDLTDQEFLKSACCSTMRLQDQAVPEYISLNRMVKESIDWRHIIYIPPVKNQGDCSSCWAFTAIGSVEAAINKARPGTNVSLSEQFLIDCSTTDANGVISDGCRSGAVTDAFNYVIKIGGIASDINYPYMNRQGRCKYDSAKSGGKISRWMKIPRNSEKDLKAAVSEIGPVSVHIKVTRLFRQYKGGIFYDPNCKNVTRDDLNHGVVVIGYGSENGQDYWLIRNSWSSIWGEEGYMKLARNVGSNCGAAFFAVLPVY